MVREAMDFVKAYDPELGNMIEAEYKRQQRNIELIASENIVSEAVMAAMGSVLTNKYAEGYPGKRYYGGCGCVDEVERLAISRVCEVFGAKFANVQPHSGAQANMAVYQALCKPGDTVMGMSLDNGGHLTHGSPVNQSGLLYHIVSYGVDDNGYIDYDAVRDMAKKEQPKMIIAGASAYPRAIDFEKFAEIAHEVGAYLFVDMAHIAGLVAAGLHQSPVPYADVEIGEHTFELQSQDPARSARRRYPHQQRGACQEVQQGDLPGHPGRSARARHRGEGCLLRRGTQAGVQGLPAARR